jgi:TPR repeat protein
MPEKLISCASLRPATISSVPINDFAIANQELATEPMEQYFSCCGKSICRGCIHSFSKTGNNGKCPFCNSDQSNKTEEELVEELMKRVAANDAASMKMLAGSYYQGLNGVQQDHAMAFELFTKSAGLGNSEAHNRLGSIYHEGGDMKKAKFHLEAAAMAGHDGARFNVGYFEGKLGNMERAVKHLTIAASAGRHKAMHHVRRHFELVVISRKSIDSTLTAYNSSCAEMRSEARDAYIRYAIDHNVTE